MAGGTRIYGSGIPKDTAEEAEYAASVRASDSGPGQPVESADPELSATVEEFRAEALSTFAGSVFGDPFGLVVAVKGNQPRAAAPAVPAGDDAPSRGFLDGPDGEALAKALDAVGYPAESLFGIQMAPLPAAGARPAPGTVAEGNLRSVIELVDPVALVALDARAAQAVAAAYGAPMPPLPSMQWVLGRKTVFLDDFEAALQSANPDAKRRAWIALKELAD